MLNKKTNTIFILLGLITSLFLGGDVFAEVYTASVTTTGTVMIDVAASGNGANIGKDNVNIVSTCPLGYTLSIGGTSDNSLYKDGDNTSEYYIAASEGTKANPKPITGDDGNGHSYLNTWGYAIGSNITSTSNFIGLTDSLVDLTVKESASAIGGDTLPIYYGVSVDNTAIPGYYKMAEGTAVTYYLTANPNCGIFKVKYNGNNADSGTTMSVEHSSVQENDSLELYASNYIRSGYGFAGWSTEQIDPDANNAATLISDAAASGKIYGPNEIITADDDFLSNAVVTNDEQVVILYAVWIKPVNNATLQNWTGCSSMSIGDVTALIDSRDNDVYAVAKLADGNCWMIENLRLDAAASMDESKSQGFGGVFHGLASSESANFSDSTVANSLYSVNGSTTYTIDSLSHTFEGTDYSSRFFPRYNNTNTASTVPEMTDVNQNIYSYGNYYTWAAAAANTDFRNGRSEFSNYSENTSICPAGWTLPKGSNTQATNLQKNNFYHLGVALTGKAPDSGTSSPYYDKLEDVSKFVAFPNNFVRSSNIDGSDGSTIGSRGNAGQYWSNWVSSLSTDDKTPIAGYFQVAPSVPSVYIANAGTSSLYAGFAVRCMMGGTYTINYNANTGSGTMSSQTGFIDNKITLSANSFTAPADKEFNGWNTAANGSGSSFTEQEVVVDLAVAGGSITLYAQWVPSMSINNLEYMQDFSTLSASDKVLVLDSMVENAEYQLKDDRDEKTYYISKLADGNVWMTQNLDHDIVSTNDFYTYDNTDIGHGSTIDTSATWTADRATYTTSNTTWVNTFLHFDYSNFVESYDPGDKIWDGVPDSATDLSNMTQGSNLHYSIGNYYSFAAAVAMNDISPYNNSSFSSGIDLNQSICPAGWTLPKNGDGDKSLTFLANQYGRGGSGDASLMLDPRPWESPLYFSLSGKWGENSGDVSYSGNFWASYIYYMGQGYVGVGSYFIENEHLLGSGGTDPIGMAYSIRCVLR